MAIAEITGFDPLQKLKTLFYDEEDDEEFHGFPISEIQTNKRLFSFDPNELECINQNSNCKTSDYGCSDRDISSDESDSGLKTLFYDTEGDDEEFYGFPKSEIQTDNNETFSIDSIELECINQNSNSKTSGYGSSDRDLSSDESDSDILSDSDYEEVSRSKREKAMKERRSLLENLMSDLRHDVIFKKMTNTSPSALKLQNQPRRQAYRRQTLYSSRNLPPVTRRRSKLGDPNYMPDSGDESEDEKKYSKPRLLVRFGPKRKLSNDSNAGPTPKKRTYHRSSLAQEHHIIPVEDITEAMLNNIAKHSVGKEYNTASGTSCHQCRQKTMDTKSCCRNKDCVGVRGQFCGPCLQNRYGESVHAALLDPDWSCPVCRGFCNCSICRNRSGRAATGILIGLARHHGFTNVKDYLASLKSEENFIEE